MATKKQIKTGDRVHFPTSHGRYIGVVDDVFRAADLGNSNDYFYIKPVNRPRANFIHGPYTANELELTA